MVCIIYIYILILDFFWIILTILILLVGLKSAKFSQWQPSDGELDLLVRNPKRRRVTAETTIGTIFTAILMEQH